MSSCRPLALASCLKKDWLSVDQRPPTRQARTTNGHVRSPWRGQVRVLLPSPRAQKCCPIHPGALRTKSAVVPHSGHHCCVSCELRAMEQRQPVRHHFESSLVLHTTRRQVEVTDSDVECDSASGLSADAGCSEKRQVRRKVGVAVESAATRVCGEAGARVSGECVKDMDFAVQTCWTTVVWKWWLMCFPCIREHS